MHTSPADEIVTRTMAAVHAGKPPPHPLDLNAELATEALESARKAAYALHEGVEIFAAAGESSDPALKALAADLVAAFARFEAATG